MAANSFSLISSNFKAIGLLVHNYFYFFAPNTYCARVVALSEKTQVPFSMAIGNGELMHECFPKHSSMGTARTK